MNESAMNDDALIRPLTQAEMEAIRGPAGQDEPVFKAFRELFRRVFRRIPFAEDLATAYFCAIDPRTAPHVRVVLAGALAYFILPLDGIADFLPLLGFTDDAAILATAIATVRNAIEPQHRDKAKTALMDIETL